MIVKYIGYDTVQKAEYFYLWLQNLSRSLSTEFLFPLKHTQKPHNIHSIIPRWRRKDSWKFYETKHFSKKQPNIHGKKDKGYISFGAINLFVSILTVFDNSSDFSDRKSFEICSDQGQPRSCQYFPQSIKYISTILNRNALWDWEKKLRYFCQLDRTLKKP